MYEQFLVQVTGRQAQGKNDGIMKKDLPGFKGMWAAEPVRSYDL
jgi:hypothetical protein